jgi:hypothetical protein
MIHGEKAEGPGWRCRLSPAAPPGALKGGTYPPSIECRALTFDTIIHIARLALRRGGRCPLSGLTRLPGFGPVTVSR